MESFLRSQIRSSTSKPFSPENEKCQGKKNNNTFATDNNKFLKSSNKLSNSKTLIYDTSQIINPTQNLIWAQQKI